MSSNFWARKLAGNQPPQQASPVQQPSGLPWWMTPSRVISPPVPAERPEEAPEGHHVIQPSEINLRKLPSSFQQDRCPTCDSPDYFSPTPVTRKRCFSCGYPLMQSGSGMSNTESVGRGKGTPARQVSNMTLTSESGMVIGRTAASAGAQGQGNYNPTDTRAGHLS